MTTKKTRILIADDEKKILELLSSLLEDEVKMIFTASDGEEAFEIIKNKEVDVVLSDINMPRMNGLELLRKVKEYDKSIQFVLITAFADKKNTFPKSWLSRTLPR